MKLLILLLFTCNSFIAFGQELECAKFKKGNFKSFSSDIGTVLIKRKKSKQIEYTESLKIKLKFDLIWLDDCTYTLQLKKVLANPNNVKLNKALIVKVEIIETKENSYIQNSTSNLYNFSLQSEIIKIK